MKPIFEEQNLQGIAGTHTQVHIYLSIIKIHTIC